MYICVYALVCVCVCIDFRFVFAGATNVSGDAAREDEEYKYSHRGRHGRWWCLDRPIDVEESVTIIYDP